MPNKIIAGIAAIYAAGILFSLWWGPIYPHQVGMAIKHYGTIDLGRGVGFGEGANSAGGIMAVLTAFVLFVYRPRNRFPALLSVLCLAALAATMSRGAVLAFIVALGSTAALWTLRLMASAAPRPRLGMRVTALWCAAVIGIFASFYHPASSAAWQRLVFDQAELGADADGRIDRWSRGLAGWLGNSSLPEQMLGKGFRSSRVGARGAYATSHNAYIEILIDFGVVGLLLFGSILAVAVAGALRGGGTFALVALVTMTLHSLTEVFWYGAPMVVLLILAIMHMRGRDEFVAQAQEDSTLWPGADRYAGDVMRHSRADRDGADRPVLPAAAVGWTTRPRIAS